jgi:hypothetical protein
VQQKLYYLKCDCRQIVAGMAFIMISSMFVSRYIGDTVRARRSVVGSGAIPLPVRSRTGSVSGQVTRSFNSSNPSNRTVAPGLTQPLTEMSTWYLVRSEVFRIDSASNWNEYPTSCKIWGFHGSDYEECRLLGNKNPVRTSQETRYIYATESNWLILCKIWGFHGCDCEECRLLGYKNRVRTSQEIHYVSATEPSQLMLCKIWGFHGGHYEECCLLGYKKPVRTSQEIHYVSATEPSQLMLCKIWGFHDGHYEECRLLGRVALWLLQEPMLLSYW